jgi:cytochrome c553
LADLAFFESKIRPLLAEHCYSCHSAKAEKLKGGLYVDSLEGLLQGGDSGPALVPGEAAKSLLLKAVSYTDPDLQMPPKGKKLSDRQIAELTQWVKSGAPWPASDPAAARPIQSSREITEKDKTWWAFQPLRRPAAPPVHLKSPPANPIDAFVRAELDAKGLKPNPPATRRELVRRAYFDLIGLPPAPEQIVAFEKDKSPGAWESLIDHLLALPQYGERWGRHWLDIVRFAQSNGYERDGEKPEAWRYRDYVVKAFNEDKPYDRFVQEQIAGDELDHVTPDSIVATGFQRLGVWDDEPDDKRMAEFDELDDVLSTTGSAFLGLTIGCARCHDHKFDPIPQADYYRLLSFFRNIRLSEGAKYTLDSPNYVPLAEPAKLNEWRTAQEAKLKPLQDRLIAASNDAEKQKLAKQVEAVKAEMPPFEWALAVRERGLNPPPTHVLIRGNAGSPGPEVQPAFLSVLGARRPDIAAPADHATSTGRRRALAEWITGAENPLTARVLANRVWQHHFGRGIVRTPSDFGRAGAPPTHPKLLDWLAAEFIGNGRSIKKLHKTIMLSQTYQMSSRAENAKAGQVDPGNELLWRQNLRRLEAEVLRDTMLAISGRLNTKMGGRGFFPRLSGEVLAGQSRPGLDWEISSPDELSRRSLYAYVRRTMAVPMLDAFDYSNTTSPLSERPVTTVAPQSLLLLNDEFMQQQAAALAHRLEMDGGLARPHPGSNAANLGNDANASLLPARHERGEGRGEGYSRKNGPPLPSPLLPRREERENAAASLKTGSETDAFIQRGFQLALGRDPTQRERRLARDFMQRQQESFASLRTRMTFRPDVPTSLAVSYMDKLQPEHFLLGPTTNWSYHRGRWSAAYEGIRTVERDRGPFALSGAPGFSNGVVEAKIVLHTACESAGLLFRAVAKENEFHGYEIGIEPREQQVVLRRHAAEVTTLAKASAIISTGQSVPLRIQATDTRLRVWLGDERKPVLDVCDPKPLLSGGQFGVRTWGAALSVEDLVLRPDGMGPVAVRDEQLEPPAGRALQSFCLLLLNLNEVVYVD